jgi:hypothetical protein
MTQTITRLWLFTAVGLVTASLIAGGQTPPTLAPALDEPMRLLQDARQSYQNVRDYTCTLVKRERLQGQLEPEQVLTMKCRQQPFSVYLRWHEPRNLAGQEACYVAGRHNGMMRVHSAGLLGAVGFVSLDPRDPRAQKNSRHSITEAGFGNLIESCARAWEADRRLGKTQVRVAEYEFAKRRCTRVELTRADSAGGQLPVYRTVLYLDKETRLPVRVEAYDWPRKGGSPDGELIEVYSYVDLRFNVGLTDNDFNY